MPTHCWKVIGNYIPTGGRGEFSNKLAVIGLLLVLGAAGCHGELYSLSGEEVQKRARQLPLKERYDFYLRYERERPLPKSWFLAPEVAALGEPAWHYAIIRGTTGKPFDLWNALPILDKFERKCTVAEHTKLMNVAATERAKREYRNMLIEWVNSVCKKPENMAALSQ
jgi:hypothetical protein